MGNRFSKGVCSSLDYVARDSIRDVTLEMVLRRVCYNIHNIREEAFFVLCT